MKIDTFEVLKYIATLQLNKTLKKDWKMEKSLEVREKSGKFVNKKIFILFE